MVQTLDDAEGGVARDSGPGLRLRRRGGERGGGAGPDTAGAEKYFLEQIHLETGDAARFVSFREVSRESEGEGGFASCLVKFEGEFVC